MSDHDHTEFVEGCFRCDLNKDEVAAIEAENEKVLAGVMRRILTQTDVMMVRPLRRQIDAPDLPLVLDFEHCGTLELTDEEFEILGDIQDAIELADITRD